MHEVIDAQRGGRAQGAARASERLPPRHLADADLAALAPRWTRPAPAGSSRTTSSLRSRRRSHDSAGASLKREQGRYEIANVPRHVRSAEQHGPIATKYDRVTFDLEPHRRLTVEPRADLLAPGHPLHDAVMDEAIAQLGGALNRGRSSSRRPSRSPQLLVGVVEEVADATGESVAGASATPTSTASAQSSPAGPAPYLDCVAAPDSPARPRRAEAAVAGRGRGQGHQLDHRQPAAGVPRRGAAAPRRRARPRPAGW